MIAWDLLGSYHNVLLTGLDLPDTGTILAATVQDTLNPDQTSHHFLGADELAEALHKRRVNDKSEMQPEQIEAGQEFAEMLFQTLGISAEREGFESAMENALRTIYDNHGLYVEKGKTQYDRGHVDLGDLIVMPQVIQILFAGQEDYRLTSMQMELGLQFVELVAERLSASYTGELQETVKAAYERAGLFVQERTSMEHRLEVARQESEEMWTDLNEGLAMDMADAQREADAFWAEFGEYLDDW